MSGEQNFRFKGALEVSQKMYEWIKDMTEWFELIKEDFFNKDYVVESLNDFQVKSKKFKVSEVLFFKGMGLREIWSWEGRGLKKFYV